DAVPLAIVVARPGGGVDDETSLLGNTRLAEVSAEAAARGVRSGFTMAAARARAVDLCVRVVRADAVEKTLARGADALLVLGAAATRTPRPRARRKTTARRSRHTCGRSSRKSGSSSTTASRPPSRSCSWRSRYAIAWRRASTAAR